MFVLVTGGAASGKSAFAESITAKSGFDKKLYIATMRPYDDESIERIKKHHIMRKDRGFYTVEIYETVFSKKGLIESDVKQSAVIFECMSNYLSNVLFDENGMVSDVSGAVELIKKDIVRLVKLCPYITIVTNEVFSDGIVYSADTMMFIKILGELNTLLADIADEVYEVVCGIPICIKRR